MALIAELRHNNRHINTETGTFSRLDRIAISWCNSRGKAATIKRHEKGKNVTVVSEYRHDGSALIIERLAD